jgi:hypothetical protein
MRPVTVALSSRPARCRFLRCPDPVIAAEGRGIAQTARPFQGREECGPKGCECGDACPSPKRAKHGRRVRGPAARGSAASGREGNEPHQRRVRAPDACASESLSVHHVPDQQRRAFREAVCEERAGTAAGAGASRQARGVILPTGQSGKQRGDVKRAGASARTSEHDQASPAQPDPMVSALGVVGGTPGWAVRWIIGEVFAKLRHGNFALSACTICLPYPARSSRRIS